MKITQILKIGLLFMVLSCESEKIKVHDFASLVDHTNQSDIISGCSGLVSYKDSYFIIRDNSNQLYEFTKDFKLIKKIDIFSGVLPKESKELKKRKPDLEALVLIPKIHQNQDGLLLIPSGSKENRVNGALVVFKNNSAEILKIKPINFKNLYQKMSQDFGKLNIEGAIFDDNELKLFQRGNSKDTKNAIISVKLKSTDLYDQDFSLAPEMITKTKYFDLGTTNTISYSFTDALYLEDNRILYLATAEKTDDAYLDGDIYGMAVGLIGKEGSILWQRNLTQKIKFEGIARKEKNEFFLITDTDNDGENSKVFTINLNGLL